MRMLITGASSGIGREVAVKAAEAGFDCVLVARREAELELTRGMMKNSARHVVWPLDLADADGGEAAIARLMVNEGPFDALVYCAGVLPIKAAAAVDEEAFNRVMRVNCTAFLLMARSMRKGIAIAVSSVSAREGWPGGMMYCASKGALSAAVRALDAEFASKGLAVRAVEPSHVRTRMFYEGAARMGVPETAAALPEEVANEIMAQVRDVLNLTGGCENEK